MSDDTGRLTEDEKERLVDVLYEARHKIEWFLVDVVQEILAARVAAARADALKEAADDWQHGQWADAPRCTDRIQERIANGQHVTDWLRARAAALRAVGETTEEGE